MSNPGVITLIERRNIAFRRFVVEDNIAESVHIHGDSFRLDFSLNEFNSFTESIQACLRKCLLTKGLDIDCLDDQFMFRISSKLGNLKSANLTKVKLSHLKCQIYLGNFHYLYVKRDIIHSPVYKYLNGSKEPYLNYCKTHRGICESESKLNALLENIKYSGFNQQNPLIIFNGKLTIVDGQHRAAILMSLYGDIEVPVLDLYFYRRQGIPRYIKSYLLERFKSAKKKFHKYFSRAKHRLLLVLKRFSA
jgi:hypothetical protein